jgi:predicted dehydrogenase
MKIRIAFLGLGSIGKKHLNIISSYYPQIEKILIINKRSVEKKYKDKFEFVTKDINSAINLHPDGVIISTPSNTHLNYAKKFLENNINILLEKPLSNIYESKKINNLIDLVKAKKNITFLIGYVLNYNLSLNKFKELVKNNNLGKIIHVHSNCSSYLPNWRKGIDYKKTVSVKKNGGGVVLELSHEIDYLFKIFGKMKSVIANLYNSKSLDIKVEEIADLIFINNKNFPIYLHLAFNKTDKTRYCIAFFERGRIFLDLAKNEVIVFKENLKIKHFKYKNENIKMYKYQIDNFIQLIKKGKNHNTMFYNSVEVMKIIHAIKRSNKLHKRILI